MKRRPPRRKSHRCAVWRLDLACGHVAFALATESHDQHGWYTCQAHTSGRARARIVMSTPV